MLKAIVAVNQENVIGSNNKMPWHHSEDLKHFREKTLNEKIIMGRKTFENLPKKLDQREVFIVSRSKKGKNVIEDFEFFLRQIVNEETLYYIAGGEEIYKQAMPYLDEIILSRIPNRVLGDTYFPEIDLNIFYLDKVEKRENFSIEYYKRKGVFHEYN